MQLLAAAAVLASLPQQPVAATSLPPGNTSMSCEYLTPGGNRSHVHRFNGSMLLHSSLIIGAQLQLWIVNSTAPASGLRGNVSIPTIFNKPCIVFNASCDLSANESYWNTNFSLMEPVQKGVPGGGGHAVRVLGNYLPCAEGNGTYRVKAILHMQSFGVLRDELCWGSCCGGESLSVGSPRPSMARPSQVVKTDDSGGSSSPSDVQLPPAQIPPLFKQCDPRWANDKMGTPGPGEQATICREGCAMSCIAMALAGAGFSLPAGNTTTTADTLATEGINSSGMIDPGSLNTWLQQHHGYHCAGGDCNNLVLTAPDALTGGRMRLIGEWPASAFANATLTAGLLSGEVVFLAHVHNPVLPTHPLDHFVLLDSFDPLSGTFGVRDPYFNVTRYLLTDFNAHLIAVYLRLIPMPTALYCTSNR